jgi:hypothetical protein
MSFPMSTWSIAGYVAAPRANTGRKLPCQSDGIIPEVPPRARSDTRILRKVERASTPATMAMTRRVAFVWRL